MDAHLSRAVHEQPTIVSSLFLSLLLLQGATASGSICAPGGNFDLRNFFLELPVGKPHKPDTIPATELSGCSGYTNDYFFTNPSDGSLVMKVPGSPNTSDCVTTPHSKHCRTELAELNPRSWSPLDAVNRLSATLTVIDAGESTCIGQVHIEYHVSVRPVCELYYNDTGHIEMGVEVTRAGGNQTRFLVGQVPVGTQFSYEIRYEGGELSVQINDGEFQTLPTYELDNPPSYFKAGNYLQGSRASEVWFYAIDIKHAKELPATDL